MAITKTNEESATSVVKELKKQTSSDGTNIIKEYKDIFGKAEGSDLKDDAIADADAALPLLKAMIEEKKRSISNEHKRAKWDFASSPHEHFGKTLDDTYGAFLSWARVKQDPTKANVSKALRRLESYADWMHDTGTELTDPALSAENVKVAVDAWKFNTSVDGEGRLVWWCDMGRIDVPQLKKDFTPEDHMRAFVWYIHAVMYDQSAQTKGLVFVYNVNKMGMMETFTLMPAKLGAKLDKLTIGVLPIKMQCMYMFETPTWVSVFMKIIGVFMSKKMKERMVFVKDWDYPEKLGGVEAIPKGFGKFGGTLEESVIEDLYFVK